MIVYYHNKLDFLKKEKYYDKNVAEKIYYVMIIFINKIKFKIIKKREEDNETKTNCYVNLPRSNRFQRSGNL